MEINTPNATPREVFLAALKLAPDAWPGHLDQVCGDDCELRARVQDLLDAHVDAGSFLEAPAGAAYSPTVSDAPITETVGTVIGPYRLLEQIGEGGFGVVFMAEQTAPVKRRVALKVIKPGMDTHEVIARFEAERQALALMDHPNIAKVFDAGATGTGRPFFVMELVKGVPITEFCDQHQFSPKQRLELFVTVCQAVQHAHQKGIIHRDIKPTNVLVTQHDDRPVVKVIDFGIAKATVGQLTDKTLFTGFAQIVGTPLYMSPEQAALSAIDVDTRSDVYSLGVLLYELLTGTTPFDKTRMQQEAFDEVRRIIREEEPQKPSTRLTSLGSTLPSVSAVRKMEPRKLSQLMRGDLDWIVMKALEKDRTRRYDTANGFAADVLHYLADEPVTACPPSARYRFKKFTRRNRGAFAIGSVVFAAVVLAIIGLAVSNVLVRAERNEKIQALAEREQALEEKQEALKDKEAALLEAQTNFAEAARQEGLAREQTLLARRRLYASQMNLAMQAWRAGEAPRVLELLEGQRPRVVEEDLRGFEWYYLWRLCHSGRRVPIQGHTSAVLCVAFSPDGRTLASASWDRTVRLWDTQTGDERMVLRGHRRGPWWVAYSPDGKMLASGGDETETLILWDAVTGQALHRFSHSVAGLAFSPNSRVLAAGAADSGHDINEGAHEHARLWDTATGAEIAVYKDAGIVVAYSPDGKTLITFKGRYSTTSEVQFWDVESGTQRLTIPIPRLLSAALSPDGSRLATCSFGTPVTLWDTATGERIGSIAPVGGVRPAFSPDGKRLATGSGARTAEIWDIETGLCLGHELHLNQVDTVAFSPDGDMLATATRAGAIKLWNMTPPEEATTIPIAGVTSMGFSSDGGRTLLIGNAGPTKLIDVAAGKVAAVLPASGVSAVSADGNTLAGPPAADGSAIWDVRAGRAIGTVPGPSAVSPELALSSDGTWLATFCPWSGDTSVNLWNLATQQSTTLQPDPPESDRVSILCAEFSPDGKFLGAGFAFRWIVVWEVATGKVKLQFSQDPGLMGVYAMAFSPDNKALAIGTDGGAVTLWDMESGKQLGSFRGHNEIVYALAFSPDRSTLASAGAGKSVRLWDVVTGQERNALTGHTGDVYSVLFSPDGATLATASSDGTVKLWRGATDADALAPRAVAPAPVGGRPFVLPPGAFELTETGLREAIRQWPDNAELHRQLGLLLQSQGRFPEAEVSLSEVIRLRPERDAGYTELAGVLRRQQKYSEAESAQRQAIRLNPRRSWTHEVLGWLLSEQEKFAEAEPEFREAIRLMPDRAGSHFGLGRALEEQNKPLEAIACFREAIRLNPDDVSAHDALGWALLEQQQPAEAESAFRECVRLEPERAGRHFGLGRALFDQEKFAESEAALREAIRLEPAHAWAPGLLNRALARQGKPPEDSPDNERTPEC